MIVYRVGRTKYAHDMEGEGARLYGGRWNHKLTPCIYTSASRALALLEYTANISIDDIPRALSITTFELAPLKIHQVGIPELPGNWRDAPAPASTKDFGTTLLKKSSHAFLEIPSAILPEEFNYLLNPLFNHKDAFRILEIKDFVYDLRIKL
ncbi:RES family NAD+ phosphorylase [Dyadobacter chenwenxiniae]|uniref:RES family NAD+ phosphorylase n=1 Tax=Dyadobacter chenwenxiniae TaxID=2906456 RepID=A0A9X1TF96_9BACT|nr:RES family NAD+ phosphorylase [Dyadobacter chenwenxiniae]MCF0050223.1 RES family NAD+ phosphorylase [Dyadobacter chenwenxiniae]MCF0064136.1 RES family NAD+ phosphorylase [Dyadobacter chenwenxiniae]UON82862.1 RES family NAD+ phosphorylase [Dyadobacter chenwenxiniae]